MAHSSWGPGWPNCQYSKINRNFYVDTKWGRVSFPGGVRYEINELVSRLVKETANRGYRFGVVGNPGYGCWGFSCRAIRGSTRPSNHSWGLAVDINAPTNPMGSRLITDMPSWMPDLWNAYGFRWGGDYVTRPDAMHYEYVGSVADAARHTALARQYRLGEVRTTPKPTPKPAPTTTQPKDDKMYFLMKGDESDEWWLTDLMTKRHMRTSKEAEFYIWIAAVKGVTVHREANNRPQVWPQEYVSNIARSDSSNLTDATLKWYAGAKRGPMHDIIRQVQSEGS